MRKEKYAWKWLAFRLWIFGPICCSDGEARYNLSDYRMCTWIFSFHALIYHITPCWLRTNYFNSTLVFFFWLFVVHFFSCIFLSSSLVSFWQKDAFFPNLILSICEHAKSIFSVVVPNVVFVPCNVYAAADVNVDVGGWANQKVSAQHFTHHKHKGQTFTHTGRISVFFSSLPKFFLYIYSC